jgi:hypothetical protein
VRRRTAENCSRQTADGSGQTADPSIARSAFFLIGSALHGSVERRQHAFHFPQVFWKSLGLGELALTPLAGAFCNVVSDGVDRSTRSGGFVGHAAP